MARRTTSPRGGLRVHGAYGDRRLKEWVARLESALDAGRDVYAYFNNDVDGHAVRDALHLRRALTPDA